jgi:hypothetical protein
MERRQQLDIERWLKEKFREGFFNMRKCFEEKDTEGKGIVSYVSMIIILLCAVAIFNNIDGLTSVPPLPEVIKLHLRI